MVSAFTVYVDDTVINTSTINRSVIVCLHSEVVSLNQSLINTDKSHIVLQYCPFLLVMDHPLDGWPPLNTLTSRLIQHSSFKQYI